jgi:multimeric flavodoxin WrbA
MSIKGGSGEMGDILAIYGSPRREGNSSLLLRSAVEGALATGVPVREIYLRDLKMSPCMETYGCKKDGRCVIQDDFQAVYDLLLTCDGLMLASPVFFYGLSGHAKILIDRCQSLWVKKYLIDSATPKPPEPPRKGLFISVGATKGPKLFDGVLLTVRYFLEALDMKLWRSLLYRRLDLEGDVLRYPEYLEEARQAGRDFALAVGKKKSGAETE